jgi:hypothetical protein
MSTQQATPERAPAPRVTPARRAPAAPGRAQAPAPSPRSPRAAASARPRKGLGVVVAFFGLLVAVNLAGIPYYLLSSVDRVRSPLHPWFRPSGIIGQSAGILAFALFLFLWLYPIRKKFRRLAFTGSLASWLTVHVIAGLSIPLVAALHAAWHFSGLIGLGYGAMLVAWMSGIVGRYIYARIPHGKTGVELTREEVEAQRQATLQQIVDATGVDAELLEHVLLAGTSPTVPSDLNPVKAIGVMIADDLRRWRALRQLRWTWHGASKSEQGAEHVMMSRVRRLMRREITLTQQARMLDATHRLFRYWHVAHKPMAISALIAVVLHVVTAIALGVTWIK